MERSILAVFVNYDSCLLCFMNRLKIFMSEASNKIFCCSSLYQHIKHLLQPAGTIGKDQTKVQQLYCLREGSEFMNSGPRAGFYLR